MLLLDASVAFAIATPLRYAADATLFFSYAHAATLRRYADAIILLRDSRHVYYAAALMPIIASITPCRYAMMLNNTIRI